MGEILQREDEWVHVVWNFSSFISTLLIQPSSVLHIVQTVITKSDQERKATLSTNLTHWWTTLEKCTSVFVQQVLSHEGAAVFYISFDKIPTMATGLISLDCGHLPNQQPRLYIYIYIHTETRGVHICSNVIFHCIPCLDYLET